MDGVVNCIPEDDCAPNDTRAADMAALYRAYQRGLRDGMRQSERLCYSEIDRYWNKENVDPNRPGSRTHMQGGRLAVMGCAGLIKKARLALGKSL
jgi:hypothetical protein